MSRHLALSLMLTGLGACDAKAPMVGAAAPDTSTTQRHVGLALAGLPAAATELEIAAALCRYLHGYFVLRDAGGTADELLEGGTAICGGHAIAFKAMLDSCDIASEHVAMIGPLGVHALIEVDFADDSCGLFDPTFGLMWRDPNGTALCLAELVREPMRSDDTLWVATGTKRTSLAEAYRSTFESVRTSFRRVTSYTHQGYTPRSWFEECTWAGRCGSGSQARIELELEPGQRLGAVDWEPGSPGAPWDALALAQEHGNYLTWAYLLGDFQEGYRTAQAYHISKLDRGVAYELRLHYTTATRSIANFTILGAPREQSHAHVHARSFDREAYQTGCLAFPFSAPQESATLLVDVDGFLLLHAIELCELAPTAKGEIRR